LSAEHESELPVEAMTVQMLKDELDGWGVEYDPRDRKVDLQALLTEARGGGE
jgi:hypothetical protein